MDNRNLPVAVSLLKDDEATRWDAFVRSASEATFFHLSGWKSVIERVFGHRTYYLVAQQGAGISGVLPLTHVKSHLFGNSLISNAFCVYGGPVAATEESRIALEAEAIRLSKEVGAHYLEFRSLQPRHPDWPQKRGTYVTFRKPIDADVDKSKGDTKETAGNGTQRHRKRIALRIGRRRRAPPSYLCRECPQSWNASIPEILLRALKQEFGEACDIVTITHEGEAVASVMNFYFRDEVLPYYGGGTPKARSLAGNDFMYWEVMRRACERGCRLFDFGRSKVGTGSYNFKRFWGFEPIPLVYEYQLGTARAVPDTSPLNPKFRLFVEAWKRMPLPLAKLVGPLIVRGIG